MVETIAIGTYSNPFLKRNITRRLVAKEKIGCSFMIRCRPSGHWEINV